MARCASCDCSQSCCGPARADPAISNPVMTHRIVRNMVRSPLVVYRRGGVGIGASQSPHVIRLTELAAALHFHGVGAVLADSWVHMSRNKALPSRRYSLTRQLHGPSAYCGLAGLGAGAPLVDVPTREGAADAAGAVALTVPFATVEPVSTTF